jgi:uncharacterized protein YbaA (DUF1428 family)
MKRYIDGFVLPIPKERISDYEAIARTASKIWKDHGALEYWECAGDDLNTECTRSFIDMAKATDDEVIIFAWVVFEPRQARDAANEKIMADPRMTEIMNDLANPENPIIDFQRMAHGGFNEIVGQ